MQLTKSKYSMYCKTHKVNFCPSCKNLHLKSCKISHYKNIETNENFLSKFNEEILNEYNGRIGYDRFSFVKNKCAFIGFDTCRIKSDDIAAEQEQFEWLKKELEKAQGSRHIFVFCHCPLVNESLDEEMNTNSFPVELRQKYLSLFLDNKVDALFSGHTHVGTTLHLNGLKSINIGPVARAFGRGGSGLNVVKVSKDGFESTFSSGKDVLNNWNN